MGNGRDRVMNAGERECWRISLPFSWFAVGCRTVSVSHQSSPTPQSRELTVINFTPHFEHFRRRSAYRLRAALVVSPLLLFLFLSRKEEAP